MNKAIYSPPLPPCSLQGNAVAGHPPLGNLKQRSSHLVARHSPLILRTASEESGTSGVWEQYDSSTVHSAQEYGCSKMARPSWLYINILVWC